MRLYILLPILLIVTVGLFFAPTPTSAQYTPGRTCQGEYTGNGILSCLYYAYEGDVLTLWCEGCRGHFPLLIGEDIPAWRFIYRGEDDEWDIGSDPVLLSSDRGSQRTYTVTREGMYQLTAHFDFGSTTVEEESYTYMTDDPNNCNQMGCMGMEVEVVTSEGYTTPNSGTVWMFIQLDRAGATNPHNPANQATATPQPTSTPRPLFTREPNFGISEVPSGSNSDGMPSPLMVGGAVIGLLVLIFIFRGRGNKSLPTQAMDSYTSSSANKRYGNNLTSSSTNQSRYGGSSSRSSAQSSNRYSTKSTSQLPLTTPNTKEPSNDNVSPPDDKKPDNPWFKS